MDSVSALSVAALASQIQAPQVAQAQQAEIGKKQIEVAMQTVGPLKEGSVDVSV